MPGREADERRQGVGAEVGLMEAAADVDTGGIARIWRRVTRLLGLGPIGLLMAQAIPPGRG
jgi:hypothetical protein